MRIVGGINKGRRFDPGKKFKARPTTDMAKESLFNILQNQLDFEELKVLDLFSGTGSISFEFASRGCTDVTAVEVNASHVYFIKETIEKLKETSIRVIKTNAFVYAERMKVQYDLIFADPPYDHRDFEKVPEMIFRNNLLKEDGLFILEHSSSYDFAKHPQFINLRKYGSVNFSFFKNSKDK